PRRCLQHGRLRFRQDGERAPDPKANDQPEKASRGHVGNSWGGWRRALANAGLPLAHPKMYHEPRGLALGFRAQSLRVLGLWSRSWIEIESNGSNTHESTRRAHRSFRAASSEMRIAFLPSS